jgi:hypothetical protein
MLAMARFCFVCSAAPTARPDQRLIARLRVVLRACSVSFEHPHCGAIERAQLRTHHFLFAAASFLICSMTSAAASSVLSAAPAGLEGIADAKARGCLQGPQAKHRSRQGQENESRRHRAIGHREGAKDRSGIRVSGAIRISGRNFCDSLQSILLGLPGSAGELPALTRMSSVQCAQDLRECHSMYSSLVRILREARLATSRTE